MVLDKQWFGRVVVVVAAAAAAASLRYHKFHRSSLLQVLTIIKKEDFFAFFEAHTFSYTTVLTGRKVSQANKQLKSCFRSLRFASAIPTSLNAA